jgi:hypothetical protein
MAGGAIHPELFEDRVGTGERSLYRVEPGFRVGPDGKARPELVDTRSILRLFFAPPPRPAGAEPAPETIPDFAAAARDVEDLTDRLATQSAAIESALALPDRAAGARAVAEVAGAIRAPLAEPRWTEVRRSLGLARVVDVGARERVIVEAFRISTKTRTALALAGYNDISSGHVENRPLPVATFGESRADASARKLLAAREKLEAAVDAQRGRVDALVPGLVAEEGELPRALRDYKAALTGVLEDLAPTAVELPHMVRALSDLPPTQIHLPSNEFQRGDTVQVVVSTVHVQDPHDERIPIGAERDLVATWIADVGRIGWHRTDSLIGILARGDTGGAEATNWELSFAGGVIWSWYQDDDQPLGRFYSWLQPGFGIHLAALDQQADDVEFGIGIHIAFWEGLVMLGVGENLTVDHDSTYYLIGGDLLGWTEKITGTVK